ncbi:hypothetical protein GIB67_017330 [Kingdonia uniflora]|uniref:Exportin-T n=1 Tax=Kingdonia uniflora TaxID=39325 RepID=A0A7J7N5X1_9MAGN|nr:hypothetical protein GIB67_017330 [Kingdonia uniflora]
MDDLERAILISFDESGKFDPVLKSQAISYCQQLKETPLIYSICLERLPFTEFDQVRFWCLQTLHEVIRLRYSTLNPDEKSFIRESVILMVTDDMNKWVRVLESPAFIKNKVAQVFVTLIYFEYPSVWSNVFMDFLAHLNKGARVIDIFCRVLNGLDDELISLDYPRNTEETAAAGVIKDAMRQQCVSQIVRAWYDIITLYRNSDQELCISVMDSMRRYISWIDIGLIANDAFVPLLFELILVDGPPEQLRGAAASCVLAIVSKRMEPQSKLSLLRSLQINRVCGLVAGDCDSELVLKLASLLTGYACEALDCSKRLDSEEVNQVSMELLDEILPSVFYVMKSCELDSAFNIVQFLSGYVATMKSLSPLKEKQVRHISEILEVIRVQICYEPEYRDSLNIPDKIGREEEDRMVEFRKDLFVLLRSVGRVAPEVTQSFIGNSLGTAVTSPSEDKNVEEIEAAVSLFYALGESISDEGMKSGNGLLKELLRMLLSTRFPCHSNRLVALVYLETVTRYMKFVQDDNDFIPLMLTAFLDERGIHHPNLNVSRRASYLFMRLVKLMKAKLVPYIETILQSLQDTVAQLTNLGWTLKDMKGSGSEDGSHIFEAIGLLIGMEDVSVTEDVAAKKQFEYLSSLLNPLCQQVEILLLDGNAHSPQESSAKIATIQQIIMAMNALSKGFSQHLVTVSRPAIGDLFKKTLDILLQILVAFPKIDVLRNKVTSFIHRMVEVLGESVFPCLPKALEQLLAESEEHAPANNEAASQPTTTTPHRDTPARLTTKRRSLYEQGRLTSTTQNTETPARPFYECLRTTSRSQRL